MDSSLLLLLWSSNSVEGIAVVNDADDVLGNTTMVLFSICRESMRCANLFGISPFLVFAADFCCGAAKGSISFRGLPLLPFSSFSPLVPESFPFDGRPGPRFGVSISFGSLIFLGVSLPQGVWRLSWSPSTSSEVCWFLILDEMSASILKENTGTKCNFTERCFFYTSFPNSLINSSYNKGCSCLNFFLSNFPISFSMINLKVVAP